MVCPDCDGRGKQTIIVHFLPRLHTCFRCGGTGEVPDAMANWIARGKAMRDRRVNGVPYRTQREEAARRGIDVVTLSKMERGCIEPDEG